MPFDLPTDSRISEQARRLSQAALDLLFPPRCAGCRRPGVDLCQHCLAAFPALTGPSCDVCCTPLDAPGRCRRCAERRPAFSQVASGFRYEGVVRRAILALKYNRRASLADPLARALAAVTDRPEGQPVLCAVPMHRERQKARGYNHAALLAEALAGIWQLPVLPAEALERVRATPTQVQLDYDARLANVRGAFSAQRRLVEGRAILLVDDVCTTGATLNTCAEELLAGGACSVGAVSVARAL